MSEQNWARLLCNAALPALWLTSDGRLEALNAVARGLAVSAVAVGEWVDAARRTRRMQTNVVCAGPNNDHRVFECCVWPVAGAAPASGGWLCLMSPCDTDARGVPDASNELLPICARCRRVREGTAWVPVETYACEKLGRRLTHGLCPACAEEDLRTL